MKKCVNCEEEKPIRGHGMCSRCYSVAYNEYLLLRSSAGVTFAKYLRGEGKNVAPDSKTDWDAKIKSVLHPLVRLIHADPFGYCYCITCGKRLKWTRDGMETGHLFSDGSHSATRYLIDALFPQCHVCNCVRSGEPELFRTAVIELYGQEKYDELEKLSHSEKKWNDEELQNIYEETKYLYHDLLQNKQF